MCYMAARSSTVGVRELRQNLSVYLDRVKRGEALAVTERGVVVASLRPAPKVSSVLERLVAEGKARAPLHPYRPMALRGRVRPLKGKTLSEILDELREDKI
jgi:prevent-host-death family protein